MKDDFLHRLRTALKALSKEEQDEVLADYEMHFIEGTKLGKSEEEICDELGSVHEIASQYLPHKHIRKTSGKAGNITLLCLWLLGDVSVVLPLYLSLWALYISYIAIGIGLLVSGGAGIIMAWFVFGAFTLKLSGFLLCLSLLSTSLIIFKTIKPFARGILEQTTRYIAAHKIV